MSGVAEIPTDGAVMTTMSQLVVAAEQYDAVKIEHFVLLALIVFNLVRCVRNFSMKGFARSIPFAGRIIDSVLSKEIDGFLEDNFGEAEKLRERVGLPDQGEAYGEILEEMRAMHDEDWDCTTGKTFAFVYTTTVPEHHEFVKQAHNMFMDENGLNPMAFPSLRRFENEVVSMTIDFMRGGPEVVGNMTSGGTESILLAIKTYRDRARALYPHIVAPEIVMPCTAHVAFDKAGKYFDVKINHVPIKEDGSYEVDMDAYRKAINKNTILLVGSAPSYPWGVLDPIGMISALGQQHNLPVHVDACIGGFMLPFVREAGYPVGEFDFTLPGVTSMSADVHKYGYAPKGASVIMYRGASLRKFQFTTYSEWGGGLYASPTIAGTRPGGPMAGAWASMRAMGREGYTQLAELCMETAEYVRKRVRGEIKELEIVGKPVMTLLAIKSRDAKVNIYAVADVMEQNGWHMERQQFPDCIHMTIMAPHAQVAEELVDDLAAAVQEVKRRPELAQEGSAAMYGYVGKIPDQAVVDDFLTGILDKLYN